MMPMPGSASDSPSPLPAIPPEQAYGAILVAVTRMGDDVRDLRNEVTTLRASLGDNYVQRRDNDAAQQALTSRVQTLEGWRLDLTQQLATFQQNLTIQVNAAVVSAIKDNAATQVTTAQQVSSNRIAGDDRTMTFLQTAVITLVSVILTFLLMHSGLFK